MEYLKEFIIPFKGLPNGIHTFKYIVNRKFFECFEASEIAESNLQVTVELLKKNDIIQLNFNITGKVQVQCDRCLDLFDLPIQTQNTLVVKFAENRSDITDVDDLLYLAHSDHEINIAQHIYEYIHLSLPYQRVHPSDEHGNTLCNKNMLKRLENFAAENNENSENIDPRWDALKQLLN